MAELRPQSGSVVACSCGVPGCRELDWPHEWDPIAASDTCVLSPGRRPVGIAVRDGQVVTLVERDHAVTAPYVRLGSGYACASCAEAAA